MNKSDYERLRANVLAYAHELHGDSVWHEGLGILADIATKLTELCRTRQSEPAPDPDPPRYLIAETQDAEHWELVESEDEARAMAEESGWTTLFIQDATQPDLSRFLDATDFAEMIGDYANAHGGEVYEDVEMPSESNETLRALLLPWLEENVSQSYWVGTGNARELEL